MATISAFGEIFSAPAPVAKRETCDCVAETSPAPTNANILQSTENLEEICNRDVVNVVDTSLATESAKEIEKPNQQENTDTQHEQSRKPETSDVQIVLALADNEPTNHVQIE